MAVGLVLLAALLLLPPAFGQTSGQASPGEAENHLISLLAADKPAVGVWTGAIPATRIAKVLATSDADFIVADLEHDIYDFQALHRFLLEIADFQNRYRTQPRPAPAVLVKLAHRAGWNPQYEISEVMRLGPAVGVWVPMVESGAEAQRVVSTFAQSEQTGLEGLNAKGQGGHTGTSPLWPLNPQGQLLVVAMIETQQGVSHAEEIIATPGIAAVHAVHLPESDYDKILKLCQKHHVVAAIDASPEDVRTRVDAGWRLISIGWDFGMLQKQLADTLKATRAAIPSTSAKP